MAIAVASTSTQAFAEGSVSFTKPTGVAVNDVLVWVVACSENNSISTPSGWTVIANPMTTGGTTDIDPYIFYRVADSTDVAASSYSIDVDDGSGALGGVMMRVTGGDVYTTFEQLTQDDDGTTGTSRSHVFSTTPTFADSLLIAVGARHDTGTNSSYASTGTPTWTEQFDQAGTSFSDSMFVVTAPYSSTTEVTSFTFTSSVSTTSSYVALFVLRPSVSGDGIVSEATVNLTANGSVISSTNVSVETEVLNISVGAVDGTGYSRTWTPVSKS